LPHLRQPLPHLRQPLPQLRQPLCQFPQPVSWIPLSSEAGLVCSTIAVRTRATLSEIVAWEEFVVSTLAELLVGIKLAQASSCKAAARSEDDFFIMSSLFPWFKYEGYLKLVLRSSFSSHCLDAGFTRSIRFNP
jgi:hypothetical protein